MNIESQNPLNKAHQSLEGVYLLAKDGFYGFTANNAYYEYVLYYGSRAR